MVTRLAYANNIQGIPRDKDTGHPLIQVWTPPDDYSWSKVTLSEQNAVILGEVMQEHNHNHLLAKHNLKPKNKLLLCGYSGTGKTQSAKVLSAGLSRELLYLNAISFTTDSAQTWSNLQKVFDFLETDEYVFVFDNFPLFMPKKKRIKRVFHDLLLLVEQVEKSIVIAKNNSKKIFQSLPDYEITRRFDEILFFEKPKVFSLIFLLERFLKNIPHDIPLDEIALKLDGLTGSDIKKICDYAIKKTLFRGDSELSRDVLDESVRKFLAKQMAS
jgi:SpoVK/Ycf46/Vps4 family AAA+-type ATPase